MSQTPTGWENFGTAPGQGPAVATQPEPAEAKAASATAPEPEDKRQQWVCVQPDGPRTRARRPDQPAGVTPVPCPVFRSDSHILREHVRCPNCGGTSVVTYESYAAAHPGEL